MPKLENITFYNDYFDILSENYEEATSLYCKKAIKVDGVKYSDLTAPDLEGKLFVKVRKPNFKLFTDSKIAQSPLLGIEMSVIIHYLDNCTGYYSFSTKMPVFQGYCLLSDLSKGGILTINLTGSGQYTDKFYGTAQLDTSTLESTLIITESLNRFRETVKQDNHIREQKYRLKELLNSKNQNEVIINEKLYTLTARIDFCYNKDTKIIERKNKRFIFFNNSTERTLTIAFNEQYNQWVILENHIAKREMETVWGYFKDHIADFEYIISDEPKRDQFLIALK